MLASLSTDTKMDKRSMDKPFKTKNLGSNHSADCPIGLCSWVFGHHDYARMAQQAVELKLHGLELMVDIFLHDPIKVKDIFSARNLSIFSMTPDNVDIAHPDDVSRDRSIDYYESLIDYAAVLGSPSVTVHEYVGRSVSIDNRALEWQRLVESCKRIAKKASHRNISVVFEPLNRNIVSSIINSSLALELAQQVDSHSFGIVLDTFHMAQEEWDSILAIERCQEYLKLYQVADSNRLGIGEGDTDFEAQFAALRRIGYQAPIVIECCVDITAPSLSEQSVNQSALHHSITASLEWLNNHCK
jgi:sugar phosphate isomerase/epimerase